MSFACITRFGVCLAFLSGVAGCGSGRSTSSMAPPPATASCRGVGDLPGGEFHSEALAVSDDGRVVVGRSSSSTSTEEGFRLAEGDTLTPLLGAGGAPVASEPRGLTPNGDVVAGKIASG